MVPLISVLIPSYNHARYIRETIESVWAQTYPNIEVVVVDDMSTDGSRELLEELRAASPIPMFVHMNVRNEGAVATVNKALSLAKGEFVSFFASDDVYAPTALEHLAAVFLREPGLEAVFADGVVINERGEFGRHVHDEATKRLLARPASEVLRYLYTHSSPFFLQAALIRRSLLLDRDPGDRESLADDWLTNIRVFQKIGANSTVGFVDKVVFYYRVHGANLHRNIDRHIALKKQMVERHVPPDLQREATANIYWEIGRSLAMRKPWRAMVYFLHSQLTLLQPQLVKEVVGKIISKAFGRRA